MTARLGIGISLLLIAAAAACSNSGSDVPVFTPPGAEGEPEGLVVTPRNLPAPTSRGDKFILRGGGQVPTAVVEGKRYVPIEATFSERSWQAIVGKAGNDGASKAERNAAVKAELQRVLAAVDKKAHIVATDIRPSVGWVSALVPADAYGALSEVTGIGRRLLVNPVVATPLSQAERDLRADQNLGMSGGFSGLEDLTGLSRMGVNEFLADAQKDLGGYRPDGSHVLLGIIDTGVTYNHPAFRDAAGKSRIEIMRDFTGEGRIFFHEKGRFEVAPGATAEELLLTVDYLPAAKGEALNPDPNALATLEKEKILVSPELKALLQDPKGAGARFGILDEETFKTDASAVDIDHNGKTDDKFYAILLPGKEDAVYVAFDGKGDFRKSPRLRNFDVARETQAVWSERVGFDIKKETIVDAAGVEVPVTTAAIVGWDPGNHGSHVAGIAAARKIIANAPDDTGLRGVAPLARLASGRICRENGGCSGSEAIISLSDSGAQVINMSIGSLGPDNDGYGVQEALIDRLTVQNGTVFVIAAGNEGPGRQTVGSPSVSRYGISVGATATPKIIQTQYKWPGNGKVPSSDGSDDFVFYFSSRGPTSAGGMKPDITAPGTWLSAIQLNAAPGATSALDVMWGTSMASPAMAGAVTLLLDAAKVYNDGHASMPVAVDPLTVRRVLLASARPFDATTFDPRTGEKHKGQYTWIDQGFGMVNLQRAWDLLKKERGARQAPAVSSQEDGKTRSVALDYQVRILRKNPNGLAYDGSQLVEGAGDTPEGKFGRGLWIDSKATESLYKVQVARRLPSDAVARPDVADLSLQLQTTADEFELETTIHGSHLDWVRPSLNSIDCTDDPKAKGAPRLLVIGEGAFDVPLDPETGKVGSQGQQSSVLSLCVKRALTDLLPPGDHGAIITAYRVVGKAREAIPSFVVPVYMTVPHKTLAGPEGLHVSSTVGSFGVARHYVDVPKDTTIVKVTLEVPPAKLNGTAVTGCSGVSLEALEGGNTATPPEFVKAPADAIAQSCSSQGGIGQDDWRRVTLVRPAPRPGIWDLHVFGLYAFEQSSFTLDVSFAKVSSSKIVVDGTPANLSGTFDIKVDDASYPLALSSTTSTFALTGFIQERSDKVAENTKLRVPNAAGQVARSYGADVAAVTIATGLSTGNDLDLAIFECADASLASCTEAATSGGPTDVESATFAPKPGKFYFAEVTGFAIKVNEGSFVLTEEQGSAKPESGTLTIDHPNAQLFKVTTAFDTKASALLGDARFTSGAYKAAGTIDVKDEAGSTILRVPVRIGR